MATLTITSARPSGNRLLISGTVDEGALIGVVVYDAEILITDLKEAADQTARRALVRQAFIGVRNERILRETAVDAFAGNLVGVTMQV